MVNRSVSPSFDRINGRMISSFYFSSSNDRKFVENFFFMSTHRWISKTHRAHLNRSFSHFIYFSNKTKLDKWFSFLKENATRSSSSSMKFNDFSLFYWWGRETQLIVHRSDSNEFLIEKNGNRALIVGNLIFFIFFFFSFSISETNRQEKK